MDDLRKGDKVRVFFKDWCEIEATVEKTDGSVYNIYVSFKRGDILKYLWVPKISIEKID